MSKKNKLFTKPTFYEQVGIIIPGSILLLGVLFFEPALRELFGKESGGFGQLGAFAVLAYAAGHVVAAIGNVGEKLLWGSFGGMPTRWITRTPQKLLSTEQVGLVASRVRSRLGISVETVVGLDGQQWWLISRQIYTDVSKYGMPDRVDAFNGNYGLNRGLASAMLALTILALTQSAWLIAGGLICLCVVYVYRTYLFGVHYARELYLQFVELKEQEIVRPSRKKAADAA